MSLRNTSRGRAIIDYYYRSGGSPGGGSEPSQYGDWLYNQNITVDNSGNISALSNDQVLVMLGADFPFANAEPDGADIRFEDSDNSPLPYFIEYYDSVNETAKVWVQLGCAALSTKTIKIYYGNNAVSSESNSAIMQRMSVHASMTHFHPFSVDGNDDIGSNNFTLNNCTIEDSGLFGNALSTNGTSGYATISGGTWTVPSYGMIQFTYIPKTLHNSSSAKKTIWHRYNDANNETEVYLNTDGKLYLNVRRSGSDGLIATSQTEWLAGRQISIYIQITPLYTFLWVNNILIGSVNAVMGGGSPFTFGCRNTGSQSNFADGYLLDFCWAQDDVPVKYARAWADKVNLYNRQLVDKIDIVASVPASMTGFGGGGETAFVKVGSNIHFYYKYYESVGPISYARLAISSDGGETWSDQGQIYGAGVGGEASNIDRVFVNYDPIEEKYYLTYITSETGTQFIQYAESTDGLTFTKVGNWYRSTTFTNNHNSCWYYDPYDQKFRGAVDYKTAAAGSWRSIYLEGDTFLTMQRVGGDLTSLNLPIANATANHWGCDRMFKDNNRYYCINQIVSGSGALPTLIAFNAALNPRSNQFYNYYNYPIMSFDTTPARDQRAGGIAYIAESTFTLLSSGRLGNVPPENGSGAIYKYASSFQNLIKDVTAKILWADAPEFSSAEVGTINNYTVEVTMTKTLASAGGTFVVKGSQSPFIKVESASISGGKLRLDLESQPFIGETLVVSYVPTSTSILDTENKPALEFIDQTVTNNVVTEAFMPNTVRDFDAENGVTVTSSPDIDSIVEQANSISYSQATASQKPHLSTVSDNSFDVVNFSAAADQLLSSGNNTFNSGTSIANLLLFGVFKLTGTNPCVIFEKSNYRISIRAGGSSNLYRVFYIDAGGVSRTIDITGIPANDTILTIAFVIDKGLGVCRVYLNNALVNTGNITTFGNVRDDSVAEHFGGNQAGFRMDGSIQRMIIARSTDVSIMTKVYNYWKKKYNIP